MGCHSCTVDGVHGAVHGVNGAIDVGNAMDITDLKNAGGGGAKFTTESNKTVQNRTEQTKAGKRRRQQRRKGETETSRDKAQQH